MIRRLYLFRYFPVFTLVATAFLVSVEVCASDRSAKGIGVSLEEELIVKKAIYEECLKGLPSYARRFLDKTVPNKGNPPPHVVEMVRDCIDKRDDLMRTKAVIEIRDALTALYDKGFRDIVYVKREAEEIAKVLVDTTLDMNKVYRMGRSPLWHNFLIKIGAREGGYCFQWTAALLSALGDKRFKYFERHWGVHNMGKITENNAVIITRRGRPLSEGIVYDAWRGKGRPFFRYVSKDSQTWEERFSEDEVFNLGLGEGRY